MCEMENRGCSVTSATRNHTANCKRWAAAFRAPMHFLLLASLVGSCLLHPILALLGAGGGDGGGGGCRRSSSTQQPHMSPRGRSSNSNSNTNSGSSQGRRKRGVSTTIMTAFVSAQPAPATSTASALLGRSGGCSSSTAAPLCRSTPPSTQASQSPPVIMLRPRISAERNRESWWLPARRVDPDSEDYYNDGGRIDPPASVRRPFTEETDSPRARGRGGGGGRSSAGGGVGSGGQPGSSAGRGVTPEENRAGATRTAASASVTAPSGADTSTERAGKGIPLDDPLVKGWNSAKVLNPSRDESPMGGRRFDDGGGRGRGAAGGGGGREGGRAEGGREGRRYVQDTAGRGRGRGGRGRGRGGRGRGRSTTPAGMYMGNDKVPWYIKEVQDKGLDTEGSFNQWWKDNVDPDAVMSSIKEMKVEELKSQLTKMGLPTTGLKAVLAERLAEGLLRFSLSDANLQHAEVVDTTAKDEDLPNCFPQVYEKFSEAELEKIWRDSRKSKKP